MVFSIPQDSFGNLGVDLIHSFKLCEGLAKSKALGLVDSRNFLGGSAARGLAQVPAKFIARRFGP